jgi:hypothetical protein
MASKQMLALAAAIILAFLPMIASETVHPVGDAKGWTLGFDYTTWSESKQFRVSDTLRKHSISLFFFPRKSSTLSIGFLIKSWLE